MTHEEFDAFKLNFNLEEDYLLEAKGKDYSSPEDRLSGFKGSSLTPTHRAFIFLEKHLMSIERYCFHNKLESEPIEERIKDARNYLLLLAALIADQPPADSEPSPDCHQH